MSIMLKGVPKSLLAPPINVTAYVDGRKTYYTANMENVVGVLGANHGGTGNTKFKDGEVVIYSEGKFISAGITKNELSVLAGIAGTLSPGDEDTPPATTVTVYVTADGSYYVKSETGDGYTKYTPLGDVIQTGVTKEEIDALLAGGAVTEKEKDVGPDTTYIYIAADGTYYKKSENGDTYDYYSPLGDVVQTGFTKEEVEALITDGVLTEKKEPKPGPNKQIVYTAADGSYYAKSETGDGYIHYSPLGDIIATGISKQEVEQLIYAGSVKESEKNTGDSAIHIYTAADGSYYAKSDKDDTYTKYNATGEIVGTGFTKEEVEALIASGMLKPSEKPKPPDTRSLVERLNEKLSTVKVAGGVPLDKDGDSVTLPDYLLKTGGKVSGNLQVLGEMTFGNVKIVNDPITRCISFKPIE